MQTRNSEVKRLERVRRSPDVHLYLRDVAKPDIGLLLRGIVEFETETRLIAVSSHDQREHELSADDLAALTAVKADTWTELDESNSRLNIPEDTIDSLVKRGLLECSSGDDQTADDVPSVDALTATGWNRFAAHYHRMSRWHSASPDHGSNDGGGQARDRIFDERGLFDRLLRKYGPPPREFHSISSVAEPITLPLIDVESRLFELLRRRETVRQFDTARSLPLEVFSALLTYTFGCHGTMQLAENFVALKKSSPSGGALHPIEAYPLVLNISGLPSGMYHYNVGNHSLEVIEEIDEANARKRAMEFASGQDWISHAHAVFVMVARFDRFFWKYRNNSKAYKVLFLDAGHLSQTFYLLCTEFGVGPFFTAAINDAVIDKHLDLDGIRDGAVAICGCGIADSSSNATFNYVPYRARGDSSQ